MSKDKSNKLTTAMLAGKWRIRGRSGAAYVGEVQEAYDNAIIVRQVNGETTILFLDAIESMFDGLTGPQAKKEMVEGEKEDEKKE